MTDDLTLAIRAALPDEVLRQAHDRLHAADNWISVGRQDRAAERQQQARDVLVAALVPVASKLIDMAEGNAAARLLDKLARLAEERDSLKAQLEQASAHDSTLTQEAAQIDRTIQSGNVSIIVEDDAPVAAVVPIAQYRRLAEVSDNFDGRLATVNEGLELARNELQRLTEEREQIRQWVDERRQRALAAKVTAMGPAADCWQAVANAYAAVLATLPPAKEET